MTQENLIQAEISLLAYLVNDIKVYLENQQYIHEGLFQNHSSTAKIYKAFKELVAEGEKTDVLSLAKKSGVTSNVITEILTNCDYFHDIDSLIDTLQNNFTHNQITALNTQIQIRISKGDDSDEIINEIQTVLSGIRGEITEPYRMIGETTQEVFRQIDNNITGKNVNGVPYGIDWLDTFTGGMHSGDLVIIAGRTSQGKTSFALSAAYKSAINNNTKIGIWSLEMSDVQLTARILAYTSGISAKHILYHPLNTESIGKIQTGAVLIENKPVYLAQCNSSKTGDIINSIRLLKLQKGIDLAIVDYLQLISTGDKGQNKEQDIAKTARIFKNLAKEIGIPIILISQLKRSAEKDQKPNLQDLRDSGQIEEAADIVLFIYRPEFYGIESMEWDEMEISTTGLAALILAKGRNVGVSKGLARFNTHTTYFTNYSTTEFKPNHSFNDGQYF